MKVKRRGDEKKHIIVHIQANQNQKGLLLNVIVKKLHK